MENRLAPIKLDSYQPLREVVCESLREAIRKLELEGYVVMMPRRGTYVANMSIRDINEIFEIRTALESLSNGLAAEHITDEEVEHLQRLLVIIGGYIKDGNIEKIVETDIEFHDLMYHAARNQRLVGIISNLRDQLTRFRTLSMSYPGRLEATLDEHRTIVEAIANGDRKAASKAAEQHMENSEKTLLKAMDEIKKKNTKAGKGKKKKAADK